MYHVILKRLEDFFVKFTRKDYCLTDGARVIKLLEQLTYARAAAATTALFVEAANSFVRLQIDLPASNCPHKWFHSEV